MRLKLLFLIVAFVTASATLRVAGQVNDTITRPM